MIQITNKALCCGCTACYNICPRAAIIMVADKEGFLYPKISSSLCIGCGKCETVCPIQNNKVRHQEKTEGYIVRNQDLEIVEESTSGGAFSLFAEHVIKEGYVVYGTGYTDKMEVICKSANNSADLKEMRGSKFVQSNLGMVFHDIGKAIYNKQKVLFTGTPCQVGGLINYLGRKPKELLCIDFVCRGVPSPMLWENYVNMMEKRYNSKIVGARFKHKTYGYHATTMKVDFENGETWFGSGRIDPMMKAFVSELASRPSCHQCKFKGIERPSDITMFDCYGFSNITKMKDDEKGWSSILIHSEEGAELFEKVKDNCVYYSIPVEELLRNNGIMANNSSKPNSQRDRFYSLAATMPIDEAISLVAPISRKDYIIEGLKNVLYKSGLIRIVKKMKVESLQINESANKTD